jgi:hypothetical protein
MQNRAATTAREYIDALPADRRQAIMKVRAVVRRNLSKGFEEFMSWGMINYGIPLARLPETYNGQPLCYVSLASQKNYCSLYLMSVSGDKGHERRLRDGFQSAGKKLDMGKSCIRFQSEKDLALDVVGELIGSISSEKWIEIYEASRKGGRA